jgi:hypothetical protein
MGPVKKAASSYSNRPAGIKGDEEKAQMGGAVTVSLTLHEE